jgi:hypothetical protein
MMILKVLGGHDSHRQDFGTTDVSTAVIRMPYDFQDIINDHITRYNIGGGSWRSLGNWLCRTFHFTEHGVNAFN